MSGVGGRAPGSGAEGPAPVTVVANPRHDAHLHYGPEHRAILDLDRHASARAEIMSWPGYRATPLIDLPGLAAEAGVARLRVKDEGGRFGLGSFKAIGGAYAVLLVLARAVRAATGEAVTATGLAAGEYRHIVADITVTCATDGNHGRAVAWAARTFGCRCVVYLHERVSAGRADAIAAYGAETVRVSGNYDDSVRRAQHDAEQFGRFVISDTAYPGCEDVPRDVMQGYTLIAAEVLEQIADGDAPTHIFLPGGVGGLAAAVAGHLWQTLGADRPRLIVVEPQRAACLLESARAGYCIRLDGDIDTVMACLSCGEPSTLAWTILDTAADAFVAIPDDAAIDAVRALAKPHPGDARIVAGESGAAAVAALLTLADLPDARRSLGMDARSHVLCIVTEGATDPEIWRRILEGADRYRPAR